MTVERETARCVHCGLNQFVAASRMCRKCRKPVDKTDHEIEQAEAEKNTVAASKSFDGGLDFGFAVRLIRYAYNVSQRDLAQRIGVPRSYLSKLERYGVRSPTLVSIKKLAQGLGVTALELLDIAEILATQVPVGEMKDEIKQEEVVA